MPVWKTGRIMLSRGRAGTHWVPLNNLSSSERINSKLHVKVHYHDSLDKFDNQNYSGVFKRVIAL